MQAIEDEKARIRELKAKNEEQRTVINQLANDLDRNFDPSREAMGRIATLVEDIKSLEAEIETLRQTTVCISCELWQSECASINQHSTKVGSSVSLVAPSI